MYSHLVFKHLISPPKPIHALALATGPRTLGQLLHGQKRVLRRHVAIAVGFSPEGLLVVTRPEVAVEFGRLSPRPSVGL
jgi:hypothetical protein